VKKVIVLAKIHFFGFDLMVVCKDLQKKIVLE
jgi:hypothetical protein